MIGSVFKIANRFMASSSYVFINTDVLHQVASQIPFMSRIFPTQHELSKFDLYEIIEYELVSSSINYCYWYGRYDIRPTGGGADRMYTLLDESWKQYPKVGNFRARINHFKNALILHRFPLLERRLQHLDEVWTSRKFIPALQKAFDHLNVEKQLIVLCSSMPGFAGDIFLKRAFLFFMMLHRRTDMIPLTELNKLPIPADYQIPKMLHWLGVLEYNQELTDDINNHRPILSGSLKECEIRAGSILACRDLAQISGQSMCDIDQYLWSCRKHCDCPFHLTITTDY
jgi:hypothetical protein